MTNHAIRYLVAMAAFSKLTPRAKLLIFTSISVMRLRREKKIYKKKQIRRFCRRTIFKDRKLHSEYFHLYQTLREKDREFHYRYIRMSKDRFDHLLELIRDKITKETNNMGDISSTQIRRVPNSKDFQ